MAVTDTVAHNEPKELGRWLNRLIPPLGAAEEPRPLGKWWETGDFSDGDPGLAGVNGEPA